MCPRRRSSIPGSTRWVRSMRARTFTSNSWRTLSRGMVSTTPFQPTPALFTSTSTGSHCLTSAARSASSATSAGTAVIPGCSAASDSRRRSSRAAAQTRAPRPARRSAVTRPIPVDAPVTITRAPSRSMRPSWSGWVVVFYPLEWSGDTPGAADAICDRTARLDQRRDEASCAQHARGVIGVGAVDRCARDRLCELALTRRRHQLVAQRDDDGGGDVDVAHPLVGSELPDRIRGADHRGRVAPHQLAEGPLRGSHPVEGLGLGRRHRDGRRAARPRQRVGEPKGGHRAPEAPVPLPLLGLAAEVAARRAQDEPVDAVAVVAPHQLRDRTAQRIADRDAPLDLERIQERDRILGAVDEPVLRPHRQPVAVTAQVHRHHPEPLAERAERREPVQEARRAEAVQQQERRRAAGARHVVGQDRAAPGQFDWPSLGDGVCRQPAQAEPDELEHGDLPLAVAMPTSSLPDSGVAVVDLTVVSYSAGAPSRVRGRARGEAMAKVEESRVTLDTTDVDRHLGRPVGGGQLKEPVAVNDIRRWVQGMQYPNPLHYDETFAAQTRFGRIVAPQSFTICCDVGHGAGPAIVGSIPGTHMIFGGDEWWFHGPRVLPGDLLRMQRRFHDYKVTDTKFAGPTMFSRGDTLYRNQRDEIVALQRSTSVRYLAEEARRLGFFEQTAPRPEWTQEQLGNVEEMRLAWIRSNRQGETPRWGDVEAGMQLPRRAIGPHTIPRLATQGG